MLQQIRISCATQERRRIFAAGKPALLLPSGEARRSESHLFRYRAVHLFPRSVVADTGEIGKFRTELVMRTAVSDAPRTDIILVLLLTINRTCIDVAPGAVAARAGD